MTNDKMREEFEAWHGKEVAMLVLNGNAKAAYSLELNKDALLCVWKASRESLVIELPEPEPFEISAEESLEMDPEEFESLEARYGAQYQTWRKCKTAIEAAGLKVKP